MNFLPFNVFNNLPLVLTKIWSSESPEGSRGLKANKDKEQKTHGFFSGSR